MSERAVKGHHVYNYQYEIPERFKCCVEDNNLFTRHAIVVKWKREGEEIIGHVPDSLAKILLPLMSARIVVYKWENNCETNTCSRRNMDTRWRYTNPV